MFEQLTLYLYFCSCAFLSIFQWNEYIQNEENEMKIKWMFDEMKIKWMFDEMNQINE